MKKVINKKNMKKRKKVKLNWKRIIIFAIVIIAVIKINDLSKRIDNKNNSYSSDKYKVVKKDENPNYFSTFTTKNGKSYIEYKQNGSSPWAKNKYWGGTMEENGCGITALAIILSGYNENYTPEDLRKKYYPVLNYENIEKELKNTFKIENTGFYYDSKHLSKEKLVEHLNLDKPILVCVWNKPKENRWTAASHYMVLLATDGDDEVYISNPNGLENDSKSSGWYNFDELTPFIAKALYIES